jgi:hypothetical protein
VKKNEKEDDNALKIGKKEGSKDDEKYFLEEPVKVALLNMFQNTFDNVLHHTNHLSMIFPSTHMQ